MITHRSVGGFYLLLTTRLAQQHKIETISISTTYSLKWQIKGHEHYKVSPCGKVFNCQRGKEIKRVLNGGSVGYWIAEKFYTLKQLRTKLEIIKCTKFPF